MSLNGIKKKLLLIELKERHFESYLMYVLMCRTLLSKMEM